MGRTSRSDRRRRERAREKRQETAGRRQLEQFFLGACSGLRDAGWLEGIVSPGPSDASRREWLRLDLEAACASIGARLGDGDSWAMVIQHVVDRGAPDSIVHSLAQRWIRAHPADHRPHVSLFMARMERRELEEARRVLRAVEASPASEGFHRELRRIGSRSGFDFLAPLRSPRYRSQASLRRREKSPRSPVSGRPGRPASRRFTAKGGGSFERPPAGERRPDSRPVLRREHRVVLDRIREAGISFPTSAPITFEAFSVEGLLEKLEIGPHDTPESLDLALRGVDLLTTDHYDRLLSLESVRAVEHLGYQIETVLRVLKRFRGRVLLADEVGLGKTVEAGFVLKEYLLRRQVRRALILVPPALVGQWKAELAEKFSIPSITTQDREFRSDPDGFWARDGVIVASLATARTIPHRERVASQRYDLVIVDEAHHLKRRRTRGWELVNAIRSRFFLMLTATPVETELSELYNLVTLLRPGTLGTESEFRRRFVDERDPSRPVDPEKLRVLLREVMVRNTRAVCGVLLPPRTVRLVRVEPSRGECILYDRIIDQVRELGSGRRQLLRLLLEEGGSSPRAVARTAQKALERGVDAATRDVLQELETLARSIDQAAKLDALVGLVEGAKTLVFTRFRETLSEISAELRRRGIPHVEFHGGMTGPQKDAAVARFETPEAAVMVCSEVGGEGRNLQFCHRLINFDLPWNPMSIEQRIGRIHRIGQKETVEVVNLVAAGTAEERILDVLDRRIRMFELVIGEMDLLLGDFDGDREFGDRVFDIYRESRSEGDLDRGFDELTDRLLRGRRKLETVRALDESLFADEYEA